MTFDKTVVVPLDLDQTFALITQPERLRRWQTVAARVDLRVGGEYRWTVTPGHHAAGTFTEIEPGKRIAFTWGWEQNKEMAESGSVVTLTLDPVDGGTSVRLTHAGLAEQQEAAHAEGWNHYLDRLVAAAVAGDAGADPWATQPVLEAFYRRGLEGTVDMGFAELPATMVASILNLEFLVHAWDFSKALGTDLRVADALTDYVEVLAQQTISEQVRAGGSFAPAQQVAETAGSLERLMAFTGRAVHAA